MDDDVETEYKAYVARERETFETFCRQLRDNKVAAEFRNDYRFRIDSDATALQLATSLARNKSLDQLDLSISPADVSNRGAQILGIGIQRSAVDCLAIHNDDKHEDYPAELTDRMWRFYLLALKKIGSLEIRYDLEDMDAKRFGALLQRNKLKVDRLRLALGNVMTQDGALMALSKGIQSSKVEMLELEHLSPDFGRALLTSGVMKVPTLREFSINRYFFGVYSTIPSFQDGSVFGNLDSQQVTACLQQASKLEEMVLNLCYLKDEDVKLVARAMHGNQRMKVLAFYGSFITDQGVEFLADSLEGCLQFEDLDLTQNRIGMAGFVRLLKASSGHPSWKSLNLSCNADIGREGLDSIDAILGNDVLNLPFHLPHTFSMNECGLTAQDLKVLFSERFSTKKLKSLDLGSNHLGDDVAVMLSNLLENGWMLEELNLSKNNLSAYGVQKLVRLTWTHPSLKALNLGGMDIGYPGLMMIADDLPTSKLTEFIINGDYLVKDDDNMYSDSPVAVARRDAGAKAGQAFLKAVKSNMSLQQLYLIDMIIPAKVRRDISFFLELDKSGRQLLRLNDGLHPLGLWSHALAKCSNKSSVLFYLLGEQPVLFIPTFGNLVRSEGCSTIATTNGSEKRPMALAESGQVSPSAKKPRVG